MSAHNINSSSSFTTSSSAHSTSSSSSSSSSSPSQLTLFAPVSFPSSTSSSYPLSSRDVLPLAPSEDEKDFYQTGSTTKKTETQKTSDLVVDEKGMFKIVSSALVKYQPTPPTFSLFKSYQLSNE